MHRAIRKERKHFACLSRDHCSHAHAHPLTRMSMRMEPIKSGACKLDTVVAWAPTNSLLAPPFAFLQAPPIAHGPQLLARVNEIGCDVDEMALGRLFLRLSSRQPAQAGAYIRQALAAQKRSHLGAHRRASARSWRRAGCRKLSAL